MQAPVYGLTGKVVDNIEISDHVFDVPFNEAVVHQAVVRQRANARQGTASTKTRGEVTGIRRGGGITFGPKPRSYRQTMPKKMRQLALRCVLSAKVRDGELTILESLSLGEPKTREMVQILETLKVDSTALIVTNEPKANVVKSSRNIPGIKTSPADLINVVDILSSKALVMEVGAVRKAEKLWGESPAKEED